MKHGLDRSGFFYSQDGGLTALQTNRIFQEKKVFSRKSQQDNFDALFKLSDRFGEAPISTIEQVDGCPELQWTCNPLVVCSKPALEFDEINLTVQTVLNRTHSVQWQDDAKDA